jgi:hypothetical protein
LDHIPVPDLNVSFRIHYTFFVDNQMKYLRFGHITSQFVGREIEYPCAIFGQIERDATTYLK